MLGKTVVGLDVGRSAVKAVAFAAGKYHHLSFPSVVTPAIEIADEITAARAARETVQVDGKKYFTGDTARLQGGAGTSAGLSHDWIESPEYKALILSTFMRLIAMGVPDLDNAYVVLGTPSATFGTQRQKLVESTSSVIAAEMKVLPQPMGAFLSFFYDSTGVPKPSLARDAATGRLRSWAVVDVGHFTTDFLLMREGTYIERCSGSCEGNNFAAEHLSRILSSKGIQTNLLTCEQSLRSKTIHHFGERQIEAEVSEAVGHVVQKILLKANSLLSNEVATLDGVLLAGGGATIIQDALKQQWPHSVLVENPRMAVAEGFCRYGMGVMIKRVMAAQPNGNLVVSNG